MQKLFLFFRCFSIVVIALANNARIKPVAVFSPDEGDFHKCDVVHEIKIVLEINFDLLGILLSWLLQNLTVYSVIVI